MSAHKSEIRLVFNDHNWDSTSSVKTAWNMSSAPPQATTQQAYQNNANTTNHRNTTDQCQIAQTNNLLHSANLNIHTDHQTDHHTDHHSDSMFTTNKLASNSSGGATGMFHPTWDEWKQRAQLSNEKENKSKHESVSSQHTNTQQHHQHQQQQQQHNTIQTKSSCTSYTQEQRYNTNTNSNHSSSLSQQDQMKRQEDKMHVATSPIITRNSSTNQLEYVNESSMRRRHYPVSGIDFVAVRPPSPVELSSCTLAKQPGLDLATDNTSAHQVKQAVEETKTNVVCVESVQQKKIKTILSTRKESAPNLTGWRRCDSDSDSDVQNRLLARASGSIPIEYISIRRDPQPDHHKPTHHNKHKKSITTGTNTSSDRGKRIAATNTNQDELPQYNLHVSLDSLLLKTTQEAATATTELKNRNASTETSQVGHKDAGTLTDAEKSPSPPPPTLPTKIEPPKQQQQQQVVYTQRKSRYTEWQRPVRADERTYRLEILAKSPSNTGAQTKQHRQLYEHHHHHHHQSYGKQMPANRAIRVDDDDKIIFGGHHYNLLEEENYSRRSGSYPCLIARPVVDTRSRQYVTQSTTAYHRPIVVERVTFNQPQQYQLGLMPLKHSSFDTDWLSEFSEFGNKFKQLFGTESQTANTRRYYKYSRTTTDNANSFANAYNHQQALNGSSYASKAPIVEIPVTPTATLAKSSNQYARSGPVITSMSRNASATNLNSSYCKSSVSSFEPVVQRVTKVASGASVRAERQFKPINETVSRETHFRSSSSNGQAVPLNYENSSGGSSSASARQNFASSYQYSSSSKKIN